ncbi:MAG: GNAT family N-acetyltransferase [Cyanobacteria bacterium J069]|nr:MAG: GNAT family N-acetyltransferase [Cyanobacteria bacterium J069]
MIIRPYTPEDAAALRELFRDTIRHVNSRDYTPEQIEAWVAGAADLEAWTRRFEQRFVYVAERDLPSTTSGHPQLLGFGELESNGHIDRFYCHKDAQGQGVGTQLLQQIEAKGRSLALPRLYAEVSLTARPFFEHRGFSVLYREVVQRQGQSLVRFQMEKLLSIAPS